MLCVVVISFHFSVGHIPYVLLVYQFSTVGLVCVLRGRWKVLSKREGGANVGVVRVGGAKVCGRECVVAMWEGQE